MSEKLNRRDAAKAVAVGGGLLALGSMAHAADQDQSTALTGEWFNSGKLDQPCAIFQQGSVLLLINEKGDIAVGRLTEANKFTIIKGWEDGVVGRFDQRGRIIAWNGGGTWKKR